MAALSNHPDPVVTANIYASGLVDDLLQQAIVPFWSDMRRMWPTGDCYLWLMRYARGGEHLKIRIHGEAGAEKNLRESLRAHVERWLENARKLPPADPRVNNPKSPPIDAEDKVQALFPDRTFVWTTYGRTYVSLPASPWLEDDKFVNLACRCLAASSGLLLRAIEQEGTLSPGSKQTLLAKNLISALGAVGLGEPARAAQYLNFHRDWLLRFFISETVKELELRARFDAQADQSAARTLLRKFSDEQWGRNSGLERAELWLREFSALAEYTQTFAARAEYQIDPFTTDVTFPPLFKALHGMANQLGVTPLHEAYVHHLVARSVESGRGPSPGLAMAYAEGGFRPVLGTKKSIHERTTVMANEKQKRQTGIPAQPERAPEIQPLSDAALEQVAGGGDAPTGSPLCGPPETA